MTSYLMRRVAQLPIILLVISLVVFALIHMAPGDPITVMLGPMGTPQLEEALRSHYGLDRPLYEQYLKWVYHLIQGDMGRSIRTGEPVLQMIFNRLPATLTLAVFSTVLAIAISLPAGLLAAVRRNTWIDTAVRLVALAGFSIPNFVLAMLMLLVISVWLRWLPITGSYNFSEDPIGTLKLYIMPTLSLSAYYVAILTRFWRSSLLEVLNSDYIRVAYAKGLPGRQVLVGHALKNSVIPVITIVAINFAYLLGGAVVVEQIFIVPGVGNLLIQAVIQRDFPVIQGITLVVALFFIMANVIADVLYAWADPRIGAP